MSASFIKEAEISRGFPFDLTVQFEAYLRDLAPADKIVAFGGKARLSGLWVPDRYVADFVARAPNQLIGFAACDPTQPECMDELRQAVEQFGLRGVKMMPMYAGFDPRDPRCEAIYAYCEARGLPILFHTGTTFVRAAPLGFTRPWLWDEVAIRHPELHMVLAHVGHPFCEECLVVIRKHPHVYADISALYYRPWQFYNMLIAAQEYKVTHKLLFGTDYPFTKAADSINGLRNANAITGNSGLPRVTEQTVEDMLKRDALTLLGIQK
jgi:predicted TIM-barrel fold metal-dependent hydrolase